MFGILAFGDSIVFGRGVVPSTGWANKLKKYLESKDFYNVFYNLGIPGESSTTLLRRFETECKARIEGTWPGSKFVIILGIGMNDIFYKKTPESPSTKPAVFEKNMLKLIKSAKKYTKNIVFVGITPVDEKLTKPWEGCFYTNDIIKQYNDIIFNSCKDTGVLFIDIFNKMPGYQKLLVDGVHPNDKGYAKMYEIIKKFLITKKIID